MENTSYGVVWRDGLRPLARGKLQLLQRALRLDGTSGTAPQIREIAYDTLADVRIVRSARDRIGGRPTVLLERTDGDVVAIAGVGPSGIVAEIAARLAGLTGSR